MPGSLSYATCQGQLAGQCSSAEPAPEMMELRGRWWRSSGGRPGSFSAASSGFGHCLESTCCQKKSDSMCHPLMESLRTELVAMLISRLALL